MLVKQLYSQSEAAEVIGHQVLRDALAAGWIKPRSVKRGKTKRKDAKILYALADLNKVQERLLAGEYPDPIDPIVA